jgi:NAD(P)-dependent dehydrogenase (short-subunit alcohol dehydrogenase family)
MTPPFGRTAEGFETQFGVNHIGHVVLTNLLVPALIAGALRVSSSSARRRTSSATCCGTTSISNAIPMIAPRLILR